MEFLKVLSNVLYSIVVTVIAIDLSLEIHKYSKTEKTEDDKKMLKKYLSEGLFSLVIISVVHFPWNTCNLF